MVGQSVPKSLGEWHGAKPIHASLDQQSVNDQDVMFLNRLLTFFSIPLLASRTKITLTS